MRITDLLKKNGIALDVNVTDKSKAIDKLVSLHENCGNLKDAAAFKDGIFREKKWARRLWEWRLLFLTQKAEK